MVLTCLHRVWLLLGHGSSFGRMPVLLPPMTHRGTSGNWTQARWGPVRRPNHGAVADTAEMKCWHKTTSNVLLIMLTSFAPSPIASVTVRLLSLTSSTTCAFCSGVTRQQMTDWHIQHVSSSSVLYFSVSACAYNQILNRVVRSHVLGVHEKNPKLIAEHVVKKHFQLSLSVFVRYVATHNKVISAKLSQHFRICS